MAKEAGNRFPNGRSFIDLCGDSGDIADLLHEKIMAGGGYHVGEDEKFVAVESIPVDRRYWPDVLIETKEEAKRKRKERTAITRFYRNIVREASLVKDMMNACIFQTPLSDAERWAFARKNPILPLKITRG